MKLLVCGASGYIGKHLAAQGATSMKVLTTSSSGREGTICLDLARAGDFDVGVLDRGDVVALAAAISAPDICANDRQRALAVNVDGTSLLIERALGRGARVAFFSSDTVYGERSEAFDESAPVHPAGDYAQMKNEVERRYTGEAGFKSLRLSYVFSRQDKFTSFLEACHKKGVTAEIFDPFVRSVVHRQDVVDGVLALARNWELHPQSIFNFGGPQALSRVAYVQALRETLWADLAYTVVTPEDAFFRNRPRNIHMRCDGLALLLGRTPRTLVEAALLEFDIPLERYIG